MRALLYCMRNATVLCYIGDCLPEEMVVGKKEASMLGDCGFCGFQEPNPDRPHLAHYREWYPGATALPGQVVR